MQTITASEANTNIFRLMDEVFTSHQPIAITGKSSNAVLLSEEDWRGIQETLYLSSIPNMVESIIEAANTPIEECINIKDLKW